MSDEDDLEDFDADQDDLDKEEDEKETEEWEEYRKEGEDVSEEVRAWERGSGGVPGQGIRLGWKGMHGFPSSCSGCPSPSRRT